MWFESLLVLILFKFKKRPNISGIQVVDRNLNRQANERLMTRHTWNKFLEGKAQPRATETTKGGMEGDQSL